MNLQNVARALAAAAILLTGSPVVADPTARIVVRPEDNSEALVNPGMQAMIEVIGADEFVRALPFLIKVRQVLDAARD